MASEDEIHFNITEMGYIMVTPRHIYPSYYKLNDKTVLRVFVNLNYLLPDLQQPDSFTVNSTNIISTFVPREKRKPEAFVSYSLSDLNTNIIEDDVNFEVLNENFSVYDLSNELVLSLKTVLAQVRKTRFYTKEGEPVYTVNVQPVISIKKK